MAEGRTVEMPVPPEQAYQMVAAAMARIGRVEESNPTTWSLVGKARYGLNPVRLRISVLSGVEFLKVAGLCALSGVSLPHRQSAAVMGT